MLPRRSLFHSAGKRALSSNSDPRALLRDPRRPVFACTHSSDFRPRTATREAYDVACAAIGRQPNFCLLNVSMDHSDMQDAFGVAWHSLNEGGQDCAPVFIGQAVAQQRFGGNNFLELVAGYIPGLQCDVFTLDQIPSDIGGDAVLAAALIDWRLAMSHMSDLNQCLGRLSTVCPAPVLGGVLPPAGQHDSMDDAPDSMFALNGNVLRGAAAGVVLRTPSLCTADLLTQRPAAQVSMAMPVQGSWIVERSEWRVSKIGGRTPTEVVREVYDGLKDHAVSKLFVAPRIKGSEEGVALAFRGDVETGDLIVTVPPSLVGTEFSDVVFVCDSPLHDKEAIAGALISFGQQELVHRPSLEEIVTVAREARKRVVVSDSLALHWSSFTHYDIVQTHGVSLDEGLTPASEVHAPSVLQRCLGAQIPTTGIHCGAQVLPIAAPGTASGLDKVSWMASRSASCAVLRPKQ